MTGQVEHRSPALPRDSPTPSISLTPSPSPSPSPSPTSSPSPNPSRPAVSFTDITGHWASEVILKLAQMGMVTGYPDGQFRPDASITRAELITILVRSKGLTIPASPAGLFNDTKDHWAEKNIEAAAYAGITLGFPDGSFKPNQAVTRAEEATMLVRVMRMQPLQQTVPSFSDIGAGHWAFGNIEQAKAQGLISGYPDGTFRPDQSSTRAETATMIGRMLEKTPGR